MDVLKEEFIRNMSNINGVDFQEPTETTDFINGWISDATKGKIPKLYDEPLGSDTLVILASSLYFKASWKGKFDLIPKGGVMKNTRIPICIPILRVYVYAGIRT